jgi:ribosomal protein S18 acetylase RimI-like enzyme
LFIRKAKLEDLEKIVSFNIQMAKETEEKILEKNVTREGVETVLNNESKGFFLLAEENKGENEICGQLMITYEWSDWRNKNIWWIQSVFVDKNYRNRKVFSKLFKSVTKMALSKKGVGGLRLYVEKHNNSAKQVYESLGMKKTPYEIYEKWL